MCMSCVVFAVGQLVRGCSSGMHANSIYVFAGFVLFMSWKSNVLEQNAIVYG